MKLVSFRIAAFLMIFAIGSTNPIRDLDEQTERGPPSQAPTEVEEDVVDRAIEISEDTSIDLYECASDIQCANGGVCVAAGAGDKICNCSEGHLGPFCDYSAAEAMRLHSHIKDSFSECLTKSRNSAGIDPTTLFEKCGSGHNLCWIREGGVKALKCFFWSLSNSVRLSVVEDRPSDESRMQLFQDFFRKFVRERQLPPGRPQTGPQEVPVASINVNIEETANSRRPSGEIYSRWSFLEPEEGHDQGVETSSKKTATTTATENPYGVDYIYPSSPSSIDQNNYNTDQSDYEYYDYLGFGNDTFANETLHDSMVVEAPETPEENVNMDYMVPILDLLSNMKG